MTMKSNKYKSAWMVDSGANWFEVYRLKDARKPATPGNRIIWAKFSQKADADRRAEVMNMAEAITAQKPIKKPNDCKCGGRAEVVKCYDAGEERTIYGVMCTSCARTLPAQLETREEAIRAWNRNNPKKAKTKAKR